tara:strand:+ start:2145 stop:2504 length:360 start_codon:yes stop_codon:yes gene_type:complete
MKRRLLIALFSLGVIGGFGSAGAQWARHHHHRQAAFEAHVARVCLQAAQAERRPDEGRRGGECDRPPPDRRDGDRRDGRRDDRRGRRGAHRGHHFGHAGFDRGGFDPADRTDFDRTPPR